MASIEIIKTFQHPLQKEGAHRLLQHLDSCRGIVWDDPQVVCEDIRLQTDAQSYCCSNRQNESCSSVDGMAAQQVKGQWATREGAAKFYKWWWPVLRLVTENQVKSKKLMLQIWQRISYLVITMIPEIAMLPKRKVVIPAGDNCTLKLVLAKVCIESLGFVARTMICQEKILQVHGLQTRWDPTSNHAIGRIGKEGSCISSNSNLRRV